jgi:hypothetical protein
MIDDDYTESVLGGTEEDKKMDEAGLKRNLVKSLRAQGGVATRFEDKFVIGWPDCLFVPEHGPVFFTEVKLIKVEKTEGVRLECTAQQKVQLDRLHRPKMRGREWYCHGVIVAWHLKGGALYVGRPGDLISKCAYVPRPSKLDSVDWLITELLIKYDMRREE